jgi:hypothetical protein
VLSGRGLCDGPISYPEAPTECGVPECDRETSIMRRPWHTGTVGLWRGRGGGLQFTDLLNQSYKTSQDLHMDSSRILCNVATWHVFVVLWEIKLVFI